MLRVCQLVTSAAFAAGILCLLGCEEAAKKSVVHAAVPTAAPTQTSASEPVVAQAPLRLPPLPLPRPKSRPFLLLPPSITATKQDLIAKVEQKFASGEQNYKAGHLEAVRKDFDQAVVWL